MGGVPLELALVFGAPALAVAGAAAVAIPIAIHLLSRVRRTRVDWGAMRFVRLAYQRQRRRLRFERWLLLAVRCLLVVLAGLALAAPVLTGALARWGADAAGTGDAGPLHLVVDNGLSARALLSATDRGDAAPTRFESTQRIAEALAKAAAESGRAVRVWPAAPTATGESVDPDFDSAGAEALGNVQATPAPVDLGGTLARVARVRAADVADGRSAGVVAVVSDWSRAAVTALSAGGAGDEGAAAGTGAAAAFWLSPPDPGAANVQVAALSPRRPLVLRAGGADAPPAVVSARVTLRRFGAALDAERSTLAVTLAPAQLPAESLDPASQQTQTVRREQVVDWAAGQASATLTAELPVPAAARGIHTLAAQLQGAGDALPDDDVRYALVLVRQALNVTLVDNPEPAGGEGLRGGDFVRAALAPSGAGRGAVAVTAAPPEALNAPGPWREGDAVVVLTPDRLSSEAWSQLATFARGGGVVWVFAPAGSAGVDADPPAWFGGLTRGLDLAWSLAAPAAGLVDASSDAPRRLNASAPAPQPLALLLADWPALLAPVRLGPALTLRVDDPSEAWLRVDAASQENQAAAPATEPAAVAGDVVMAVTRVGAGAVALLTVPPDPAAGSNLAAKPLFPALMQDALRALRGTPGLTDALIGRPRAGDPPAAWAPMTGDPAETASDAPDAPGVYRPLSGPGRAAALNLVADAGDLRAVTAEALREALSPWGAAQILDPADPGAALSQEAARWAIGPLLLWALAALVLFEMLVARRFSHAQRPRGSSAAAGVAAAAAVLIAPPAVGQTSAAASATPSLLDRALGLETLSVRDAAAGLGWAHPLPGWLWLVIVAAAGALAWLAYRRLTGSRAARTALAACRALLLLLLAALLAGPQWVRSDETVEPDVLAVLVDRSASLGLTDLPPGPGDTAPRSRDTALGDALFDHPDLFGPTGLGRSREVAWWGFGDSAAALPGSDPAAWPAAGAPASRLGGALDAVLRAHPGRAIAGVVVFTDGQSTDATGAELRARLNGRGAAVFAVPLGAAVPPRDLAVARLEPPDVAFIDDAVPVRFVVSATGGDPQAPADPARYTAQLVDVETGDVLDEQPLTAFDQPVRLTGRGSEPGPRQWAVQLVTAGSPDALAEADDELNRENNRAAFAVELIDRPLRVLYVEGRPRWEYRYLKNMLLREKSIDVSVLLLSADDAFAQEGDTPITRLPADPDEWRAYDVIVLGDLPPAALGEAAVAQISARVSEGGAGVLWVGGEGATPAAWAGSGLENLLPMRRPDTVGAAPAARFAVAPTPLAETLSVLRLGENAGGTPAAVGGRAALRYAQQVGPLKPTAEVLARALPLSVGGDGDAAPGLEPPPLVTQLRFGAGRSVYVATDETWRLRAGRGEALYERFWVQLVRLLGRPAAGRGDQDQGVRLQASARRLPVGGTLVLNLTSRDAGLNARDLTGVRAEVRAADSGAALGTLDLRAAPEAARDSGPAAWEGRWRAEPAGPDAVEIVITEPALADLNLSVKIDVDRRDDERRVVAADRARLTALAEGTGGAVIDLDELQRLGEPGLIPSLARTRVNDLREPLTRAPAVLALILLLVAVEWTGRRLIRLA